MQRILRINVQSRNQALKATREANRSEYRKDWKDYAQRLSLTEQKKGEYIRTEQKSRREDWLLGPLAPKRDVGKRQGFYGTVNNTLFAGPVFPPRVWKGPKGDGWSPVGREGKETEQKEWEGTGNEGNIVQGDRVVVVRGKTGLVGQIGTVSEVMTDSKELRIEGLNLADIEIPTSSVEQRKAFSFTTGMLPVSVADVRLVHRHTDPATGRDRDVVVSLIRGGAPYIEREPNSPLPRHSRYIAGEDIEIPWPDVDIPSYEAYEGDSTRYDVESKTWKPTVYDPPVPPAVFEDLFGSEKYSRYRRWHEEEYVRIKVLEDARAAWYMQRKVQSPQTALEEKITQKVTKRNLARVERGMSRRTMAIVQSAQSVPGRALVSNAEKTALVRRTAFKATKERVKERMLAAMARKSKVARKRIAVVKNFKAMRRWDARPKGSALLA